MAGSLSRGRPAAVLAAAAATGLLAAGCGSNGNGGGPAASPTAAQSSASSSALGTPHPASGSPVVFGLLNLQTGPATFPEVAEAEQAAAQYHNTYQDGIGGRPIKIDV